MPSPTTHLVSLALILALAPSLSALQADGTPVAGFDLEEINTPGHPNDCGIDFEFAPVSQYNAEAGGLAVADFNDDGFDDVYFGSTEGRASELYVNNGDGTFTEAAAALGVDEPTKRRGNALFIDYDGDGDLDLMTFGYPSSPVTNLDLYSMFRNDGAGAGYTFTDVTAGVGGFTLAATTEDTTLGEPGGAAAADYDNDGDLDVVVTYWHRNTPTSGYAHDQFRLWKNVPNPARDLGEPDYSPRLFTDATLEAGLDGVGDGWVWQPTWTDVNRDGYVDLHINIETGEDELLLNNGDGTFAPSIATAVGMNYNNPPNPAGAWGHEMGTGLADYDNDGDIDFLLTNPGTQIDGKFDAFYRNDSDLSTGGSGLDFRHIGPSTTDPLLTGVGWGAVWADLDNDADLDLLTVRGLGMSHATNHVLLNQFPAKASDGLSTALVDVSAQTPGFMRTAGNEDNARALAAFDFDNDGDLDTVYTRTSEPVVQPGDNLRAAFFRNTLSSSNNWFQLLLRQTDGSLNTIGARVFARSGGVGGIVQMREVTAGDSFLSQNPMRMHFGFGADTPDWVAIRWFDGGHTVLGPTTPLTGFLDYTRGGVDATGDVNGDGVFDCTDIVVLKAGVLDSAQVDSIFPDWPWRITGDMDGNGHIELADVEAARIALGDTWCNLGHALTGTNGVPSLFGTGTLVGGENVRLTLTDALENSSAWLVVGFSVAAEPFKGGVLVPSPDLDIGPLPTGPNGFLGLLGPWPVGLPADLHIVFQYWIVDPAGPFGASATNAMSAITP